MHLIPVSQVTRVDNDMVSITPMIMKRAEESNHSTAKYLIKETKLTTLYIRRYGRWSWRRGVALPPLLGQPDMTLGEEGPARCHKGGFSDVGVRERQSGRMSGRMTGRMSGRMSGRNVRHALAGSLGECGGTLLGTKSVTSDVTSQVTFPHSSMRWFSRWHP